MDECNSLLLGSFREFTEIVLPANGISILAPDSGFAMIRSSRSFLIESAMHANNFVNSFNPYACSSLLGIYCATAIDTQ